MKGSILFNKDINIEVDVDPSAEEGARLISAKNLVDGQEAGGGDLETVEVTLINTSESYALEIPAICVLEEGKILPKYLWFELGSELPVINAIKGSYARIAVDVGYTDILSTTGGVSWVDLGEPQGYVLLIDGAGSATFGDVES